MWSTWLERTLNPRETADYVANRDERARAYARMVEERPRAVGTLSDERVEGKAVCEAL